MEHAEDAASNDHAMGEDQHSQEHENPPPPPPPNRLEAAMALLLENQNVLLQAQLGGRVDGSSILDRFRRLCTSEFGGSTIPADAEFWLHGVERVFGVLAVPEQQKISLTSFNLKGDALAWWENYYRQLTTLDDGVAPRVVTWDMFVRGFNNKYCPPSYRLERENTFLYLKQGDRSVAEYEAEFASLSRFAVDLVSTDERRCQRFRHGLNEGIASRLISF